MASKAFVPSRAVLEAFSPTRRHATCKCIKIAHTPVRIAFQHQRDVSTATTQRSEMEVDGSERPRWSQTPLAMTAPYPTKARPANWQPFKCNSDPRRLDEMYTKFLGPSGSNMLSEETKWLAVTHKSFDHGRRGFNDRLAFLGKRILELQTSLGLLSSTDGSQNSRADPHGREPFMHPATNNAEALLGNGKSYFMHHTQIAKLAEQYSIPSVVRWQPKSPDNLLGSGSKMVYAQTVFAIIGALALEQGGAVANRIARERVIQPLGLQQGIENTLEDAESS